MIPTVLGVQQISSTLLDWLGSALLMGTILAGLTWLVVRLLKDRVHPGVEVLLWAVVLIKFVVPVGQARMSWSLAPVTSKRPSGENARP